MPTARIQPRPLHRPILAAVVVVVCMVLLLDRGSFVRESASADVLTSEAGLKWYRGNLHTHSLWSDGDDYPEMIALWYKQNGYDFLSFSDHNTLLNKERWIDAIKNKGGQRAYDKLKAQFPENWVDEKMVEVVTEEDGVSTTEDRLHVRLKRFPEITEKLAEPGQFLLIQGEEISDRFANFPIHLNVSNVQDLIPPLGGESVYDTIQNNVNAAIAQRERTGKPMMVHVNHPNFYYALTAEDLMRVRGENFFEVYNGHPSVANQGDDVHPGTERIWDIILTKRIAELGLPLMYGLATDDGHEYHEIPSRNSEPGRGWVMVLAGELETGALIDALERGRFYASSGVTLKSVTSSSSGLAVEIDAEPEASYTIDFIGTQKGFDASSEPRLDDEGNAIHTTRRYSDDIGAVLKTVVGKKASYQFQGNDLYVRARITSSTPHPNPAEEGEFERAWVQPALGPAAPAIE